MTTRSTDEGSTAQQIWDQLDQEDVGTATAAPTGADSGDSVQAAAPAQDSARTEEAPEPAATAAQAADAQQAPTPAPQDLLDKISGLESMLTQVTTRLRNAEGHIGSLNGQLKQQLAAARQVAAQGADAPTAEQIRDAQGSAKAMEALKKDYPEFAERLEAVLAEQRKAIEQQLASSAQPQALPGAVTREDLEGLRGELQVDTAHPGWKDLVKTPEFGGWLHRQPREVQLLAASPVPGDAIRLLDLHRDSTRARPEQQTNTRLAAAAAIPTGRGSAAVRAKPIEEMTEAEYWAYLDATERQTQR